MANKLSHFVKNLLEKISVKHEKKLNPLSDDSLWQTLKNKRLELARQQGVPPYVIFHDSTLSEIHALKPKTRALFSTISGVGQSKLDRYSALFIEVIERYERETSV